MKSAPGQVCASVLFVVIVYTGVAYQTQRTVLSTDFAFAEIERADPVRMMTSTVLEYLPVDASPVLTGAIDTSLAEQRPWLVAELRQAAVAIQDYLRGDAVRAEVVIDPAPLRVTILEQVDEVVRTGAHPELVRLPLDGREALAAAARQAADDAFARMGTFTFDSAVLPANVQDQLAGLRAWLGVLQLPLWIAICAVVALGVLCAVLGQLRMAGVAALAAGIVLLVPAVLAARLAGLVPLSSLSILPGVVAAYLPALAEHVLAPMRPAATIALVAGAGLFGLSFAGGPSRRRRSRRR